MYWLLRKFFIAFNGILEKWLPNNVVVKFRRAALRLVKLLYPNKLHIEDVDELGALLKALSNKEKFLPSWVYNELNEIHEIDSILHPLGKGVASVKKYSPLWTYDAPGVCYFDIRSKFKDAYDVLFIVPWLRRGGADLGLTHFANTLVNQFNLKVAVVTTEPGHSSWAGRLDKRVDFFEVGDQIYKFSLQRQIDILVRLLLQVAPKSIHIINSRLGWECVKRNGLAIKHVSNIFASLYCDDVSRSGQRVGYAQSYLGSCYQFLSGVISDNYSWPIKWCNEFGFDRSLFYVVKFPAPEISWSRVDGFCRNDRSNCVLWASRLDRQKRPDLLLKVAKCMPGVEFHVYGDCVLDSKDPPNFESIPNIKFRGVFDNFSELIAQENYFAYLYTSEWDGLPNVLLEASASGIPIVASGVGGVVELLDKEQCVFPCDNIFGYVARLSDLQKSVGMRHAWRMRQIDSIKQSHTQEEFEKSIINLPGYINSQP